MRNVDSEFWVHYRPGDYHSPALLFVGQRIVQYKSVHCSALPSSASLAVRMCTRLDRPALTIEGKNACIICAYDVSTFEPVALGLQQRKLLSRLFPAHRNGENLQQTSTPPPHQQTLYAMSSRAGNEQMLSAA